MNEYFCCFRAISTENAFFFSKTYLTDTIDFMRFNASLTQLAKQTW